MDAVAIFRTELVSCDQQKATMRVFREIQAYADLWIALLIAFVASIILVSFSK